MKASTPGGDQRHSPDLAAPDADAVAASEPRPAILVDQLAVGYGGAPVLRDVSFAVEGARSVAVLGPNGGGKTTLFRALTAELAPSDGRVALVGRPAYVAQTERTRLDFPVSAVDVALMGSLARGRWWLPATRAERAAARAALERVGLSERTDVRFGALSGGQRQRVLLARALVQDAPVLLLDEPLAGVDPASAERIGELFDELRAEGRTLLVATHDVESARRFDLVLCLNGRQVAYGSPDAVLDRDTLQATYGHELIVLDGDGGTQAVCVQHHEHPA
jgi:manganese/iron transport system ATP-binding protein/manganese/zinc/iron transport system ATP- binding protein